MSEEIKFNEEEITKIRKKFSKRSLFRCSKFNFGQIENMDNV